jgi:hypothetical protein
MAGQAKGRSGKRNGGLVYLDEAVHRLERMFLADGVQELQAVQRGLSHPVPKSDTRVSPKPPMRVNTKLLGLYY